MERLESLLACPGCHADLDGPGRCDACGREAREVNGWYLDAVDLSELTRDHRARADPYARPLAPRLYDLDVRVTSSTI